MAIKVLPTETKAKAGGGAARYNEARARPGHPLFSPSTPYGGGDTPGRALCSSVGSARGGQGPECSFLGPRDGVVVRCLPCNASSSSHYATLQSRHSALLRER